MSKLTGTLTDLKYPVACLPTNSEKRVKKICTLLAITATCLTFSTTSLAEYRWVADSLYVPLRSGKGNQYRILDKGLKTGTRLTFVSEDIEGGWTEVKTESGEIGYIRSQYLMNTPAASQRLASTQEKLRTVESQFNKLKQQLSSSSSESKKLILDLNTSEQQNEQLKTELNDIKRVSADAIGLHQRHQELMHDHQIIQTELDVLKAENQRLQNDNRNTFFIYGAGAVLLGVLIAVIAPRLRRRKSFSEWG